MGLYAAGFAKLFSKISPTTDVRLAKSTLSMICYCLCQTLFSVTEKAINFGKEDVRPCLNQNDFFLKKLDFFYRAIFKLVTFNFLLECNNLLNKC